MNLFCLYEQLDSSSSSKKEAPGVIESSKDQITNLKDSFIGKMNNINADSKVASLDQNGNKRFAKEVNLKGGAKLYFTYSDANKDISIQLIENVKLSAKKDVQFSTVLKYSAVNHQRTYTKSESNPRKNGDSDHVTIDGFTLGDIDKGDDADRERKKLIVVLKKFDKLDS